MKRRLVASDDSDEENTHAASSPSKSSPSSDEEEAPTVRRYSARSTAGERSLKRLLAPVRSGKDALMAVQEEDEEEVGVWKEETAKEREKRLMFVIDDDGTGYCDDDVQDRRKEEGDEEEEDLNTHFDGAEDGKKRNKKKKMGVQARVEHQSKNIMDMFSKVERHRMDAPEQFVTKEIEADLDVAMDDTLSDLLASAKRPVKPKTAARPPMRSAMAAPASSIKKTYESTTPPSASSVRFDDESRYSGQGTDYLPDPEVSAVPPPSTPVTVAPVPSARSKFLALAKTPRPMKPLVEQSPSPPAAAAETLQFFSPATPTPMASLQAVAPALPSSMFSESPVAGSSSEIVFPTSKEDDKECINMYWLDMWEDRNIPGDVFVIGHVPTPTAALPNKTSSALVILKNVQRTLFVVPRGDGASDELGRKAIQEEAFETLRGRLDHTKRELFRFRSKWVTRSYAFELPDIPRGQSEFLMIQYSMALEPRGGCGETFVPGRTFAHVFGANQSAIERLVLQCKLMGPSWVTIRSNSGEFAKSKTGKSHAKYEAVVDLDHAALEISKEKRPTPKMSVLSIALKTVVNPTTHHHEIVAVTGILHPEVPLDASSASKPPSASDAFMAFQLVRPLTGGEFPPLFAQAAQQQNISCLPNERSLLSCLMAKIHLIDPDMLMGHNIVGFDIDLLMTQMKKCDVSFWSKLGRLNLSQFPRTRKVGGGRTSHYGILTPGRLLLDTYLNAQEFMLGQREYSLSSLAETMGLTQPGRRRMEIDPSEVPARYKTRDGLLSLLHHAAETAHLTLGLAFRLESFTLTFELTTVSGNLWRRTLGAGRAERIEYLLLHAFYNLDFVCPDKEDFETSQSRKRKNGGKKSKVSYTGGLVLEPKVGLYDTFIVLLDFNALYPSLIQEHNVCFTTVERPPVRDDDDEDDKGASLKKLAKQQHDEDGGDMADEAGGENANNNNNEEEETNINGMEEEDIVALPADDGRKGLAILPTVIKSIVDRRVAVKNQLATESDPMKRRQLDTRQKALKIIANSMYGCLGFSGSRFFARPLASLITSRGRLVLQDTVATIQALGYEVVYGDTDSVMIDTKLRGEIPNALTVKDMEPVHKIAEEIQKSINPKYRYLKIALDGVFHTLLLLKKKKYAALSVQMPKSTNPDSPVPTKRETKGLDLVRRDWCLASRDVGSAVLDLILSGKPRDDVVEGIRSVLMQFQDDARNARVGLEKWSVTKGLNKSPKDYPDVKGQPHLQVALAMMECGKVVNTGDHIPYVICSQSRVDRKAALLAAANPEGVSVETKAVSSSSGSFADRAFHPDEIREPDSGLTVDVEWYLATQIFPPVQRLCNDIEGVTSSELAEALGLDPVKHRAQLGGAFGFGSSASSLSSCFDEIFGNSFSADMERFKNCEKIELECLHCSLVFNFPGLVWLPQQRKRVLVEAGVAPTNLASLDSVVLLPGTRCPRGCDDDHSVLEPTVLQNLLSLRTRQSIKSYYEAWLVSDDPSASDLKTRQQSLRNIYVFQGRRVQLHRKFSAKDLWVQLLYFVSLVDDARMQSSLNRENDLRRKQGLPAFVVYGASNNVEEVRDLNTVKAHLETHFLHWSGYSWIRPDFFAKVFRV